MSTNGSRGYNAGMTILVPATLYDELAGPAHAAAPGVTLRPYTEDDAAVPGLDEAEGVLRWVAGKRFSELVSLGPKGAMAAHGQRRGGSRPDCPPCVTRPRAPTGSP